MSKNAWKISNDIVYLSKLKKHVVKQMNAIGAYNKGEYFVILCPFHRDSNPSLRVNICDDLPAGAFHCFSCGEHGPWNKLAEAIRLVPFEKEDSGIQEKDNVFRLMHKTLSVLKSNAEELPDTLVGLEPIPDSFQWRQCDKSFLEALGAKLWWDRARDLNFLYFPLTMGQQYVGYTLCNLDRNKSKVKYLSHADTLKTFFLYDFAPNNSDLILVEGHADALRLFRYGIPVLGIFGTENWGPIKKSYLYAKAPKKVWILFDGDDAGHKASQKIFTDLREGCEVDILYLPIQEPKLDPDSMPESWVLQLKGNLGL